MPYDPERPLLRLNQPKATARRQGGGGGGQARRFERDAQARTHGPIFQRLQAVLTRPDAALRLQADANSLAPERLLVFEVTGPIQNFFNAVARVPGLEFAGEEEMIADEFDEDPEFYLLVPQLEALNQIISLWSEWQRTEALPRGYAPWAHLFTQLKSVRPWGPRDRVSEINREYFFNIVDGAPDAELVRIEIELVYRAPENAAQLSEANITARIATVGGRVVDRSRRPEFNYHAVLADLPAVEIRRIAELDPNSLAGADPVVSIVPQSVGTPIETADPVPIDPGQEPARLEQDPIAAVFDAVPLQAHPLLADWLAFDDPSNLEAQAVGVRIHGTAMASLAIHGDLNGPPTSIGRRLYFRPVMYAPAFGDEIFDGNKLVVDVIVDAVMQMRADAGPNVIVVNLSLGDRTKPFYGRVSTWARALDYLAFTYGILFLVSAGNTNSGLLMREFATAAEFEAAEVTVRSMAAFRALDAVKADRRLLAPAESLNALTIGAWHRDAATEHFRGVTPFVPYHAGEMPNLSSRLGLGISRSAKPEALFAGGRQRARLDPVAAPPILLSHQHPSRFWGVKAAAPTDGGGMGSHFTIGTSAATALATHTAHRIYEALDEAYPELVAGMPLAERACLLKTLLVHTASWRGSDDFIRSVLDPGKRLHHEHWRREVSRHLGYGFVDPDDAVTCASDRATMWATGTLSPEGSIVFDVPIPAVFGTSAVSREVRATLAWFAPTRPGHLAYRAVKLRVPSLQSDALEAAGVGTTTGQPSNSQSESGTILHRRWRDERIGELPDGGTIPVQVQREKDQGTPIDEDIPFGLAVTVEMPGAVDVYDQVLANIIVRPRPRVRT